MATPLSKDVGSAADAAMAATPSAGRFAKVAARDGMSFRSYYSQTDGVECEISLYKDKWWTKDGGTVHAELFCLVHEVQLALAGVDQSWLKPDFAKPFHHFQFGITGNRHPQWAVASPADVTIFRQELQSWLAEIALPWFDNFNSRGGVIDYMRSRHQYANLARFLHSIGRIAEAQRNVEAFVRTLSRQPDRALAKMTACGLLTTEDQQLLLSASMQREDEYRGLAESWIQKRLTENA